MCVSSVTWRAININACPPLHRTSGWCLSGCKPQAPCKLRMWVKMVLPETEHWGSGLTLSPVHRHPPILQSSDPVASPDLPLAQCPHQELPLQVHLCPCVDLIHTCLSGLRETPREQALHAFYSLLGAHCRPSRSILWVNRGENQVRNVAGRIEPEKEEETPTKKKKNPQLETSCREHFCKGGRATMLYALRSKTERGMQEMLLLLLSRFSRVRLCATP